MVCLLAHRKTVIESVELAFVPDPVIVDKAFTGVHSS